MTTMENNNAKPAGEVEKGVPEEREEESRGEVIIGWMENTEHL